MPRYRVQRVDRNELDVEAHRVVQLGEAIIFEKLVRAGCFEEVQRLDAGTVGCIRKQVEEAGGFRHYVSVRPARVSSHPGRSA